MVEPEWHKFPESKPHDGTFVWVRRATGEVCLAILSWDRTLFNNAESAGDREGLSVEGYWDVTHWTDIIQPEFIELC